MAGRVQLARVIHSKTALAQQHAQPALPTLLRHGVESLALRAWRESTRVAGALWRAQSVLTTRPLQKAALLLATVCVRQGSMGLLQS